MRRQRATPARQLQSCPTVASETRHARDDQARVRSEELIWTKAKALQYSWSEGIDEDIGAPQRLVGCGGREHGREDGQTTRVLQRERDGALSTSRARQEKFQLVVKDRRTG